MLDADRDFAGAQPQQVSTMLGDFFQFRVIVMKRYRWTKFFIDTERNLVRHPAGACDPRIVSGAVAGVTYKHGLLDIQDKYDRWLSLSPPSLCVKGDVLK